jgi:hypothetical protein
VTIGGGSGLNSNDALAKVTYPDSADGTDNVTYKYNRQGQVISMKDQAGSVHTYEYDKLGRQLHDRITTLAAPPTGPCGGSARPTRFAAWSRSSPATTTTSPAAAAWSMRCSTPTMTSGRREMRTAGEL